MDIIDNIPVWGAPVDEGALKQIKTCYYIFAQAAMMADHQKGYGVPIGSVIAHETLVSPSGVGYDIGCGNKAVLTEPTQPTCAPTLRASWMTSGTRSPPGSHARTRNRLTTNSSMTTTMMPGRSLKARTARRGS